MDRRRVRLQLRLVQVTMQHARPADRSGMVPRAIEILDGVATQIDAHPDAELARQLATVRGEVRGLRVS